jgi:hypothetical protein
MKYTLGNSGGYVPRGELPSFNGINQLTANHLQAITRGIDRATVVSGEGYEVARYSNATVIRPKRYVTGSGFRNFQVFTYTDSSNNVYATVSVGTVNRVIAKIGSLYLDQVDPTDCYIVVESTYEPNKPFPTEAEIKQYGSFPSGMDTETKSVYILASVKYVAPSDKNGNVASANASQIHERGNLACSRIRVGGEKAVWQWWTV